MSDNMIKYGHRLSAEQSVTNFIEYVEEESGEQMKEEDKKWLYEKAIELFDAYYIDDQLSAENYTEMIQQTLAKMYGHIILLEYKLYLLNRMLGI